MAIGLYELIGGGKNGDITSTSINDFINNNHSLDDETQKRLLLWKQEFEFWESYTKIYHHTQIGRHYRDLVNAMNRSIGCNPGDSWLDLGCGPGRMSQLIMDKTAGNCSICATDIILEPANKSIGRYSQVRLIRASLGEKLPFDSNSFDGAVANLVIPYIIEFEGDAGKTGIKRVFTEIARVLRPGAQLAWSTPKKDALPQISFVLSIPDMLREINNFPTIPVGLKIVGHARELIRKGRISLYTLLSPAEWDEITSVAGFVNSKWQYIFSHQVWVNTCYRAK